MTDHRHASHPAIVERLKRAEGHRRSVVAMIEAGKPCLDIAQQLEAVERPLTVLESAVRLSTKLSPEPVDVAGVMSRFLSEARLVPIEPADTAIAVDAFQR